MTLSCNLRFAGDITIFWDNPSDLQTMIQELKQASEQCGSEMNLSKTQVTTNIVNSTAYISVNDVIAKVVKYMYLGREVVIGKGNQANKIDRRIRL